MQIIRAKTAGFCFGVDRAVKLTYDLLAQGRKVATLGPLIHNAQVVADLEEKRRCDLSRYRRRTRWIRGHHPQSWRAQNCL